MNPRKAGYGCDKCGAIFAQSQNLQRHKLRKTPCSIIVDPADIPANRKDNQHVCKFCNRTFAAYTSLRRHIRNSCKIKPKNEEGMTKLFEYATKKAEIIVTTKFEEKHRKDLRKLEDKIEELARTLGYTKENPDIESVGIEAPIQKKETMAPKNLQKIPAALRAAVWAVHIGETQGEGKCQCCRIMNITRDNYECGHVTSRAKGGKIILQNLRPVCGLCNKSMGTKNMDQFALDCGFVVPEPTGTESFTAEQIDDFLNSL